MKILPLISRTIDICHGRMRMRKFWRAVAGALLVAACTTPAPASASIVRMMTVVGSFNVELYDDEARITVDNFLTYVLDGRYNNSIIHRHATIATSGVSVLQGGGFRVSTAGATSRIPADEPIQNEFDPSRSNVRGTIAMAKTSDPDSATSEWFINIDNNSVALDNPGNSGGFTVFGHVLDPGLEVVDALAELEVRDFRFQFPELPFGELPVINYAGSGLLFNNNFVYVWRICPNDDNDGSCPGFEDQAPGGDGNGDSIPDRDQTNVTTILKYPGGTATFAAQSGMRLDPVDAVNSSTLLERIQEFLPPTGQTAFFNNGMHTFSVHGDMASVSPDVDFHDGALDRPSSYYAYGPTPDNTTPHWYEFMYDGVTGAEILSDRIVLHFVDGGRGDDDREVNNRITHTGAQAVLAPVNNTIESGGCTIASPSSPSWQSGDWILVSLFLVALAVMRKRSRRA